MQSWILDIWDWQKIADLLRLAMGYGEVKVKGGGACLV